MDSVDYLEAVEKEKVSALKPIEPHFLGRLARNLVTMLTEVAGLYCREYLKILSWKGGEYHALYPPEAFVTYC
jgi:hypothetical protein